VLLQAYGLGADGSLKAPQADLMSTVAAGVFSLASGDESKQLPWALIAIGAGVAVAVIILDQVLKARGKTFRTPVLAVAVGIYLPIASTAPIFIGGLVAHLAGRRIAGKDYEFKKLAGRRGLLFASGIITGESLVGIILAVPFAIFQDANVWAVSGGAGLAMASKFLAAGTFIGFGYWMYKVATRRE
jgi:putative OPT family oligopeptide transporter